MLLTVLFAVMIYGAFNVWNSRDIKELALLKSVGMTEKQVKKMVRLKIINLSVVPILSGTIISYFVSNLLLYLVWLNNSFTYKKISSIFSKKMQAPDFHFISISVPSVNLIIILSFITVYLSALLPARQSAKLRVIEGLNGITEKKIKYGSSKIKGKIEASLAKDYFKAYKSTYRTIILAMLISAMVVTVVLVSQSYRTLTTQYDNFISPFNFTSNIYTTSKLDSRLIEKINSVKGIDELHIFSYKDFKIFLKDNEGFSSKELSDAFKEGRKNEDDMYVRIYGLSDYDYKNMLAKNNLDDDLGYILLNTTPNNNLDPYAFRKYIHLTNRSNKNIVVRYNAKGKKMNVPVDGCIETFPYDLDIHGKSGIYIFTRMVNLRNFIKQNGNDEADYTNYYTVQINAKHDLDRVADECEQIISSYIPKSDYSTSTDILKAAANEEQIRNEHLLNAGIQIILLIIALSNAYNSFHGNLRSRKREFQLLTTVGMTEKQIKKMILLESRTLFAKTFIAYIVVFVCAIAVRAYRSNFKFSFAVKELIFNINVVPIILIFAVMVVGVLLAIHSSIKSIFKDDLNSTIREI